MENDKSYEVTGQLVDIRKRMIYPARLTISKGIISSINRVQSAPDKYILPGFVDAHIHIESSMVVPSEFAKVALKHGTIATVSDPHEIANVMGLEGVEYMIENARQARLKFHFGVPSCVPATAFETAGAEISASEVERWLEKDEVYFLSEMMNYPGVLNRDPEVMKKIAAAFKSGKPVDGHAPGLRGEEAKSYISSGITTDHECYTLEEALDKLQYGMKIIIREGSAAKNYGALHSLIDSHTDEVMFCSDDKHPDDLMIGHINELVTRSLKIGYNIFDVLQVACINPVEHYNLPVGTLKEGGPADFIMVDDLVSFNVYKSFIDGQCVVEGGGVSMGMQEIPIINKFDCKSKSATDFELMKGRKPIPVIEAIDGELITKRLDLDQDYEGEGVLLNMENDILKIAVVNRYFDRPVALGLIKGFGLKSGAIASSVAHDSHNIIAVGTTDESISEAVNALIRSKGGLSVSNNKETLVLPLPIAGLMSNLTCADVSRQYQKLDMNVKKLGSKLGAPFMTLSFMALLVIPELKMSDRGLFDALNFRFIDYQ